MSELTHGIFDTRKPHEPEPQRQSPWEIAEAWYSEDEIARAILARPRQVGDPFAIPKDIESAAFARWLTHQYRLAMAKGIQLGRER